MTARITIGGTTRNGRRPCRSTSRPTIGRVMIAATKKIETLNPIRSFKARGVVMAVSMARALGVTEAAMPTNGNAGAAFAAYCSRAGIRTTVFCPQDTPEVNVREIAATDLINQDGGLVSIMDAVEPGGFPAWLAREIPLGRLEQPEEVAAAIAFLCSDDAAYITGEAINVSGGQTMV